MAGPRDVSSKGGEGVDEFMARLGAKWDDMHRAGMAQSALPTTCPLTVAWTPLKQMSKVAMQREQDSYAARGNGTETCMQRRYARALADMAHISISTSYLSSFYRVGGRVLE